SNNNLFLDAPNTTVNANISLPNARVEFTNSVGTNTGTLSSASGTTVSASEVDVFGNYATVNFAGALNAGTLRFNEPLSANSVSVSNAANVIPILSFVGGETVSNGFVFSTLGALDINGGTLTAGAMTIL